MNSRIKRYCRRLDTKRIYKPQGIPTTKLNTTKMNLDEFEAMRLVDQEGLSQIDAANKMQVSRATIQRLLEKGRKKMVEAVLYNHVLEIDNSIANIKLKGENDFDIEGKEFKYIAFPTSDRVSIDAHFGKAPEFALYIIRNTDISEIKYLTPPPHAPGVIPKFLQEHNVDVVITGGMGQQAISLFNQANIDIILGATGRIDVNLAEYIGGFLTSGDNTCEPEERRE